MHQPQVVFEIDQARLQHHNRRQPYSWAGGNMVDQDFDDHNDDLAGAEYDAHRHEAEERVHGAVPIRAVRQVVIRPAPDLDHGDMQDIHEFMQMCKSIHLPVDYQQPEMISEAHHSILKSIQLGPWMVHIDSHAMVSAAARDVPVHVLTALITYAAHTPDTYSTVPVGRGAYLQDLNTRASVYIHRLSADELRVETVLGPDMKPSEPLFRRPIPAANVKQNPRANRAQAATKKLVQQHGRDAVSQDMEKYKDVVPANREQRRAMDRQIKKLHRV
jgi:hypothetical protein